MTTLYLKFKTIEETRQKKPLLKESKGFYQLRGLFFFQQTGQIVKERFQAIRLFEIVKMIFT